LSKGLGIKPVVAPYELRHTAITRQCEAGHSTREIADWAGTSERMINEVYRHKLVRLSPLGPAE
jgi:integrase